MKKRRPLGSRTQQVRIVSTDGTSRTLQLELPSGEGRLESTTPEEPSEPEQRSDTIESLLCRIKRLEQRVAELEYRDMPIGGRF